MPLSPRRVQKVPPQALFFDGVDDYVVVPHSGLLDVQPGNKITIVMYAMFTGWQVGHILGAPIDKRSEGTANYNWEYDSSYMLMRIHAGGTKYIIWVPHSLNVWNHYAMVLNGSWLGGYLNGELKASRNDVPQTKGNTQNLLIGVSVYGGFYVRGYIAQVLIYSRALSPDEIAWNYNYPDNPIRNGLVLWLHWDSIDPAKGVWYDKSGFGNHGKIYGATLVKIVKPPRRVLTSSRVLAPRR